MTGSETREIQLSRGKVAVGDVCDFDDLVGYRWYAYAGKGREYAVRNVSTPRGQRAIRMHCQILGVKGIHDAYRTGRGAFRLRAKWEVEKLSHGLYQIIVTEIPYQVQKAKLIERVAALMEEKKLPFLADIRDESTEEVRIVLEPKSRTVDAEQLMEQLFRQTDLEIRFGLNMNLI